MEITDAQYRHIKLCLPTPRGNVTLDNLQMLNAIWYVAEQECQWRALPQRFGHWHTIYLCPHEPVVEERGIGSCLCPVATRSDHPCEDRSRGVGQHPRQRPSRWDLGVKKSGPQVIGRSRGGGRPRFIWLPRMLARPLTFALSPGQAHHAPEGRKLLHRVGSMPRPIPLVMDRAYEGNATRQLAVELGSVPVVPSKHNRLVPWEYDRAMYKRRSEIERLFRRLKGVRRIFSRFEKLDIMFVAFINFALIVEGLREY